MKNQTLTLHGLLVSLLLILFSTNVRAEELTIKLDKSPKALWASHATRVEILQGSENKIIVTGDEAALKIFQYRINAEGKLKLGRKKESIVKQIFNHENHNGVSVKLYVTDPTRIAELDASGASQITFQTERFHRDLEIDVSGASKIKLHGIFNKLEADLSGASSAEINGDFVKAELDLSGASSCYMVGKGTRMDVECSGASNFRGTECYVDQISYEVSGASRLTTNARQVRASSTSGASRAVVKEWGE